MIETLNLPINLAEQLDSSVRNEYERLWRLAQKTRKENPEFGEH